LEGVCCEELMLKGYWIKRRGYENPRLSRMKIKD